MRRLIRSVISLVLCASPLVAQAGSLLRNGDFEDTEFSPWIVQRWNGECDVELDRTFANAGRGSAGFGSDSRCKIALVQDLGKLDAGSYILKGYVRAINLRQGQWKRTFLVGLETPEKELFLDKIPGGTYGWRPFTRAYTINQPINGKLCLYLFGPGRLWLDGLSLERIKPEGAVSDNRGLVLGEEEGSLSSVIAESRGDIRCSLCSGGHPAGTQSCKFCGFDIASSRKAEHEIELITGGHEIAGPNLILNGSFEEGKGQGSPFRGWAVRSTLGGEHSFNLVPGRTGYAARISASKAGRGDIHNVPDIKFNAGDILRFRFWAKADELDGGVSVWFEGDPGEGWQKINVDSSTKDWKLFETRVRVPKGKKGQTEPALQFWFYNWGTGAVLFDDISACVVRPDLSGAVVAELKRLLELVRASVADAEGVADESLELCKAAETSLLAALKSPEEADPRSLKRTVISALGRLQGGDGSIALGVASSLEKIFLDEPYRGPMAKAMSISLAQNESEAAQLVVLASGNPLENVRVALQGDLVAKTAGAASLPAEQVRIDLIGYVDTTAGERPYQSRKLGWWPDPLLSNARFKVRPDEAQPLLVTVTTKKETMPGQYEGRLLVTSGASKLDLPLHIEVFPFALPESRNYSSFAFGCSPSLVAKHYGGDPDQKIMERFVVEACKRGMPPTDLLNGWGWGSQKPQQLPKGGYDFTSLDRWIDLFKEHGLSHFPMAIVPRFKKWGGGDYTEKWKASFSEFLKAYASHLKEKGISDRAIIYNIDEAAKSKGEWEICKQLYKLAKTAVPDVPVVQCLNEPDGVEALSGHADIWDLYYGHYERAGGPQRLKAGDGLFLAVCIYPSVPPNLFIEYDLLDARIFPWIGYRTGSKGFEYWDLFQWGNNVGNTDWLTRGDGTRTAWKLDNPHGDGLLMYPGPNGVPLSSLRLESFRDGLEDYEYLLKLQARSETDPFAAALLKEATEVIVTGVTSYTREPAQLLNLRVRIAKFLSTDVARSGQ